MTEDQPHPEDTSRTCTAICADGSPRRAWGRPRLRPAALRPHGGGAAPVGAPVGNQNARTHGLYAKADLPPLRARADALLDASIAECCIDHLRLTRFLHQNKHQLPISELVRLCRFYAKNLAHLDRLVGSRYGAEARTTAGARAILSRLLRTYADCDKGPSST